MTHPLSSVLIIFFSKRVIDDFSLIDENIQNKQGTNLPKGEKREKKRKETANKNKNRPKTKEKQHRLNRTVNGPINKINPQQRTENQRKCLTKSRGKENRERERERRKKKKIQQPIYSQTAQDNWLKIASQPPQKTRKLSTTKHILQKLWQINVERCFLVLFLIPKECKQILDQV